MASVAGTRLRLRPYAAEDERSVLDLVAADLLPGQPPPTPGRLADALLGRSPVERAWWSRLDRPAADVAVGGPSRVCGVVCYATRPSDGAGLILWLHCREEPTVADALLRHAVERLGQRRLYAFEAATALTLGLKGLPVRHRPVTRRALEDSHFTGRYRCHYLHARLPVAGLPHASGYTVTPSTDPPGRRLEIREAGEVVAEAAISPPIEGTGVLWWVNVSPHLAGSGIGPGLYGSAMDHLTRLGAREVVHLPGADEPGDPDRRLALSGLTEVDRLFSFEVPQGSQRR